MEEERLNARCNRALSLFLRPAAHRPGMEVALDTPAVHAKQCCV